MIAAKLLKAGGIVLELAQTICDITGASNCQVGEVIQSLWSGYGAIQRVRLDLPEHPTAIVKHIDLSEARQNRRGWSGNASHQRKVCSYSIEKTFYESHAEKCNSLIRSATTEQSFGCRVPRMLAAFEKPEASGWLLVLEDLDAAGFPLRSSSAGNVTKAELDACLRWLANFHAAFMGCEPRGLWPVGTYWHLATRQEEWQAIEDGDLKRVASEIDQRLTAAKFQTIVHGDAKLANFCFSHTDMESNKLGSQNVAAVDFQYVGGGCGMKDVAYLVSSCLDGSESEAQQDALLKVYFQQLEIALSVTHPEIEFASLETEWRDLYAFAWADFCRFLAGWSPGHWKLNEYNDRVTQSVIARIAD